MQRSQLPFFGAILLLLPLFSGCSKNDAATQVSPEQMSQRIQAIQQDPNLPAAQKEKIIASLQNKEQ